MNRRRTDPRPPTTVRERVPRDRDFALKCNAGMDGYTRYWLGQELPPHPHPDQLMGFTEAKIDDDNRRQAPCIAIVC